MVDADTWWEPPLAGTEVEHLVGALDRLRATFRWKADGLDASGLRTTLGPSTLTLGRLLKHLAWVEDCTFLIKLRGDPAGTTVEPTFTSADDDPPEELYAQWSAAVARSRERLAEALAEGGLDQPVHLRWPDGTHLSLRRIVCDLIEEYGRHTGHADLLREHVDGVVGEDPPAGWRPT